MLRLTLVIAAMFGAVSLGVPSEGIAGFVPPVEVDYSTDDMGTWTNVAAGASSATGNIVMYYFDTEGVSYYGVIDTNDKLWRVSENDLTSTEIDYFEDHYGDGFNYILSWSAQGAFISITGT